MEDRQIFSLQDVCDSIQRTIVQRYSSSFWVKADMHKLNRYPASGHCFPELLQKNGDRIVAEMRAVIWKGDFDRINHIFIQEVREPLKDGMGILFLAKIQYDPRYGLSLRILDIDSSYSLGTLQLERKACVERLKREGLWCRNQLLGFPFLPSRIAMISAHTSKGYSDFMKVMGSSGRPFRFHVELFTALLQGEGASASIRCALQQIKNRVQDFDVVVIVRGGGGDVGLNVYNHYELVKEICEFPLPVLSGIGHSTNLTVVEENTFYNAITPTDLAYYVLSYFLSFEESLALIRQSLYHCTVSRMQKEREKLKLFSNTLRTPLVKIAYQRAGLEQLAFRLRVSVKQCLQHRSLTLNQLETALKWADPERMLEKGYTLTYSKGRLLSGRDLFEELPKGSVLETRLSGNRIIRSQIIEVSSHDTEEYIS